jgi:hypothetical protein
MIDLSSAGRFIFVVGILLSLIGGIVWLAGRTGLPLGNLPGDVKIELGSLSCFFPLASTILLSIFLTVVLNLLIRVLNK